MVTLLLGLALAGPLPFVDVEQLEVLCTEGDSDACLRLGLELANGHNRDPARARVLLEPLCNSETPVACGALATTLPPSEADSAVALLQHGCQEGDHRACADLGKHHARKGEFEIAQKHLSMSCGERFAHACGYLASVEILVSAGAVDVKQVRVLQDACDRGDSWSCEYLNGAAGKCTTGDNAKACEVAVSDCWWCCGLWLVRGQPQPRLRNPQENPTRFRQTCAARGP